MIFLSQQVANFVFLLRGCVIFFPERLHDFFCPERLREFFCPERFRVFFFVSSGCVIFYCPERLRDFFPQEVA